MWNSTNNAKLMECLQEIANFSHASLQALAVQPLSQQQQQQTQTITDHQHVDGDGLIVAKVTAIFVLFLASFFCGSLPFLVQYFFHWPSKQNIDAQQNTIVKCLLYFGGGVLLCTTFIHLLPEVQETVEELTNCQLLPAFGFPLAQLLMCLGFFLMYLVEEIIHTYIHYQQQNNATTTAFERGYSLRRSALMKPAETSTTTTTSTISTGAVKTISTRDLINCESDAPAANSVAQHHHSHNHAHQHHQTQLNASLRGLFIVLALGIHELFEGMAIGLEHSTASVWVMFGAVSAHKLVLAFCVGVELIVARTRLSLSLVYIFIFAVVSPLGIGVGILVSSHETQASNVASVFLQGVACGTLLYVVFFEILSKNYAGLKAVGAMILGFAVMFGLQLLGE